jgi:AraC family transcriptional regulator
MKDWGRLQRAIRHAAQNPGKNMTLCELAAQTNQSSSHAHRQLHAALGETPKQFTLRLRLDRAAGALVSSRRSILDIALACGFQSHEAFCRAFRRRFRMSPSACRKLGVAGPNALDHGNLVNEISPCVGLYHLDLRERQSPKNMEYTISKKEVPAQPVLVVRRRVRRAEIAATIAAELPRVFLHAQRRGFAIAGYPITRYLETSVGLVTLETGMRVSGHDGKWTAAEGEGEVLAETLPGGLAAVTVHSGPYDQLQDAYAALEEWIAANGFRQRGAPWEAYLNDPGDYADPQDWKTEVCWPLEHEQGVSAG